MYATKLLGLIGTECYSQVSWIYDYIQDIYHESMNAVGTQQQLLNTIIRLAREEDP